MDGQNYLKSLHKMQIDRERLKPVVYLNRDDSKNGYDSDRQNLSLKFHH